MDSAYHDNLLAHHEALLQWTLDRTHPEDYLPANAPLIVSCGPFNSTLSSYYFVTNSICLGQL